MVTRDLVRVTQDAARRLIRAEIRLERTGITIVLARDVAIGVIGMERAGGLQDLAARAGIDFTLLVIDDVGP